MKWGYFFGVFLWIMLGWLCFFVEGGYFRVIFYIVVFFSFGNCVRSLFSSVIIVLFFLVLGDRGFFIFYLYLVNFFFMKFFLRYLI